jgi:hypothetical protein
VYDRRRAVRLGSGRVPTWFSAASGRARDRVADRVRDLVRDLVRDRFAAWW